MCVYRRLGLSIHPPPQTEIYVEVDEVVVTGVSAAERGVVTATATVNDDSAGVTLVRNMTNCEYHVSIWS